MGKFSTRSLDNQARHAGGSVKSGIIIHISQQQMKISGCRRLRSYESYTSHFVQGGPKNRTILNVDNFAMVSSRKACDMSKVFKFCLD